MHFSPALDQARNRIKLARLRHGATMLEQDCRRIATFDNNGTHWCEQPVCFELSFAFDRVPMTGNRTSERARLAHKPSIGIP
jgi:uncharacterized Zn finger protein (UPF0148 family)